MHRARPGEFLQVASKADNRANKEAERALIPTDECDFVEELRPPSCRDCGALLSGDDPDPKRKQVIDLPEVKPIVTEFQTYTLACRCCGCVNKPSLPEHVPRGWSGRG